MGGGGVNMDAEDIVLGIVKAAGREVAGRTYLQKVAYFVSEMVGVSLGFGPHYYGPYSSSVAAETESQVSMQRLTETPEHFAGGQTRYRYELTTEGEEYLSAIEGFDPEGFQKLAVIVRRVVGTGAGYTDLAYAAKLHYLLGQAGGQISLDSAAAEAKRLGWEISADDFATAVGILQKLGLAK
jgi:uncharacterized protein